MKELIASANLTQRQISDLLGVTERNINDWVGGRTLPRVDRAVALARALGVSLKQLCEALDISVEGIPDDQDENQIAGCDDNTPSDSQKGGN